VFEKNILQKILVPKTKEIRGHWKNLHKDYRHILKTMQYNLGDHVKDKEKARHAVGVSEISWM